MKYRECAYSGLFVAFPPAIAFGGGSFFVLVGAAGREWAAAIQRLSIRALTDAGLGLSLPA